MTRSTFVRPLAAAATAVGLTFALAAPAAAATDVSHDEAPMGRFYGNVVVPDDSTTDFEYDLVFFAGISPSLMCTNDDPDLARGVTRATDDGATLHERFINARAGIEVYDADGVELIEWVFTVYCPAYFAGAAPEPLATGSGNLKEKAVVDLSGLPSTVQISSENSVVGNVRTMDGERWALRGYSTVDIELTLDPATGQVIADNAVPSVVTAEVLNRR